MKQLHHSLFTFLVLSFSTFAHAQWTIINQTLTTDMAFESVAQPRKDTILFSGNFTNTVYNLNGGESGWGLVSSASPGLADMSFGSKKVGYGAASTPVNLRKTINSGASWTTITPISSNSMWCAFAVDENTAYFGGAGAFWKTINGGISLIDLTNKAGAVSYHINDIHFTDYNTGYFTTEQGDMKKTTDAGQTWKLILDAQGTAMHFTDANTAYIACSGGYIYKTIDAGANWTFWKAARPYTHFEAIHFYNKSNGVAVGLSGVVFYTTDAGSTWTQSNTGTDVHLLSVFMVNETKVLVGGEKYTIMKNNDITIPTGLEDYANLQENIEIYPNPFQDYLQLKTIDNYTDSYSVLLQDSQGATVLSSPVDKNNIVNTKNLPSGIYFCTLKKEGTSIKTIKLVH